MMGYEFIIDLVYNLLNSVGLEKCPRVKAINIQSIDI